MISSVAGQFENCSGWEHPRPGNSPSIPRRRFLRGVGTVLALPFLESLLPTRELLAATSQGGLPRRMAFLYVPNGVNMADWVPEGLGSEFKLPYILEPLAAVRDQLQILSGLAHQKAYPNGDGGGDHARASATFLTGCQARKTAAVDIRAGVSVDQLAATKLSNQTRFPSLELSCDKGQQAGSCDSGYSCAYQFNLAWKSSTTPLPPEVDPRLVFERLFSNGDQRESEESRQRRRLNQKSVLDFVLEDAHRLQSKLGRTDRRKLDEYMTSVRELEQRIERAEKFHPPRPEFAAPTSVPQDYEQHLRIMFDLLALAFQTDSTRVSTFMLAHDGSNRSYSAIGVADGHHDLSHHGGNKEKKAKIARINRFHVQQLAYFLTKLQSIKEGEGTLLDQCMIVYGSGIADGDAHSHHNLPVILAGKGGGTLSTGRHLRFAEYTPMTNLYLSLLERMNTPADHIGDSTGSLAGLS